MTTDRTSLSLRTGRPIRLVHGGETIEVDVKRYGLDAFEVTLGAPYDATIRSSVVKGCRRLLVSAPRTVSVQKVPA